MKKTLGLWSLVALVVGNMIGSGVFLLPASLAQYGSISIFGWIFTAVGAVFLGLVFAKLGGLYPKTGGPYAYCHRALGDFVGFQVAFNYWVAVWIGNAAMASALSNYLSIFWPRITQDHGLSFSIELAAIWFFTLINIIGTRSMALMQIVTTILKIVPLILVGTIGFIFIHPGYYTHFNVSHTSNLHAFNASAALTLWAFIGVESATIPAGYVKNPKRLIPLATLIGVIVAAVIYIASSVAIMGILPMNVLMHSSSPFAEAANVIFGFWGKLILGLAAIVAALGTLNGWILVQGQIPYAAAMDGLFPKIFAKLNKRQVPVWGLIISSLFASLLLAMTLSQSLIHQFTFIILLAVLASLIPYIYTAISEVIIIMHNPDEFKKGKFFKNCVIAIIAFIYSIWAVIGSGEDIVFYGVLLLLISSVLYPIIKFKEAKSIEN